MKSARVAGPKVRGVRGNLICPPVTALAFGAGLSFGERELENGVRYQVSQTPGFQPKALRDRS